MKHTPSGLPSALGAREISDALLDEIHHSPDMSRTAGTLLRRLAVIAGGKSGQLDVDRNVPIRIGAGVAKVVLAIVRGKGEIRGNGK